jgi:hypothetical protein
VYGSKKRLNQERSRRCDTALPMIEGKEPDEQ